MAQLKFSSTRDDKQLVKPCQPKTCDSWPNQRGFTLPEILVTIVILGILMAIATSSWFGLVDSRRVTSDTNQFAADLRLAHTKSTNQLKDYAVVTDPLAYGVTGSTDHYYIVEIRSPLTSSVVTSRQLDDSGRTGIVAPFGVTFKPDGSATDMAGRTTTIFLDANGAAAEPRHEIDVNTATSRVKID